MLMLEVYGLYLHGEELLLSWALGLLVILVIAAGLAYRFFGAWRKRSR